MNGRLFVEGEELIMGIDAFNGTLLWKREIPGMVRVKIKADSGNLVVTEEGLYVAAQDKCYRLDPATGETIRLYKIPSSADGSPRRWGYVSAWEWVSACVLVWRWGYASAWEWVSACVLV